MNVSSLKMAGFGGFVAAIGLAAFTTMKTAEAAVDTNIVVYKSPTCGCCHKWVEHLTANEFNVTAHDVADISEIKVQMGITNDLASCHTAVLGKYVVEGHVPANIIQKLLTEQPDIAGIAVPGMPIGSPGMEGPNARPYNVIAFDASGNRSVYATVTP